MRVQTRPRDSPVGRLLRLRGGEARRAFESPWSASRWSSDVQFDLCFEVKRTFKTFKRCRPPTDGESPGRPRAPRAPWAPGPLGPPAPPGHVPSSM
eukprot:gene13264-biopygen14083